jgi:hypothetical protein
MHGGYVSFKISLAVAAMWTVWTSKWLLARVTNKMLTLMLPRLETHVAS